MQFEFREVIDASPVRGFETIGNRRRRREHVGWRRRAVYLERRQPMMPVMKVAGPLMGMGGSSERAVRRSLAVVVKTTATPVPPLEGGVQASAHPTAPHTGTSE